jgi:hypothetical protein
MPLLDRRKILAAALEETPGTGVSVTSSNVMINAYDIQADGNMPYNERMVEGGFGRQLSNLGAYAGSLKFKIQASGSGTSGTSPSWAEICLASCGMTESDGSWTPVSKWSDQTSATFCVDEDGLQKKFVGAMGTWTFSGDDGQIPYFDFEYKGVWVAPTDQTSFTPSFSSVRPPRFAAATLGFGGYTPTASKFTFAMGNKVDLRQDVTQTAGYISAVINDRKCTGTLDPEQTLTSTYDQYAAWLAGTSAALTMTIGSGGTGFTINAPATQYSKVGTGTRGGIIISPMEFIACLSGSTVDSEMSLVF